MKKYNIDSGEVLVLIALKWFVENPYDEIYIREFSRVLKISPNSAQRFLNLFLRNRWINEIKRGNLRCFKSNLESVVFRQLKIIFSLNGIENSGMIDYFKESGVSNLIVFGSVAKGLDDPKSDLDILIVSVNKKMDFRKFEEKIGKEIQAYIFTWAEWKKQALNNKAFYQDVIKDGIALIGDKPLVD
ncbi:MAG: nucleotidyltransferase domain-containing protein [Nanoarchaeota archaeon]